MIRACVFDAYGTLFDVDAAARRMAAQDTDFAQIWSQVSTTWRAKQVGYTWHRAVTGDYVPFDQITSDALEFALEAAGANPALRGPLMDLYLTLDAYPEVAEVLDDLRERGVKTAILSNGSPDMLASAVSAAGLSDRLDHVLSVDPLRTYKPHGSVYALAEQATGAAGADIAFFSSNGWDAAAASAYGFRTIWVNRAGAPQDRLGAPPAAIARDLREGMDAAFAR